MNLLSYLYSTYLSGQWKTMKLMPEIIDHNRHFPARKVHGKCLFKPICFMRPGLTNIEAYPPICT